MKQWVVQVVREAQEQMAAIKDNRIRASITKRIDGLQFEPDKQGKALKDELEGYRSIRAGGQRYRIIYKIEEEQVLVLVVTVGIRKGGDRKDVYEITKKLARLSRLDDMF
jgi:mRNA interferase RelE/StbE